MQTVTGVKFLVVSDPKQQGIDQLLDKIYELYSDFALKVGLSESIEYSQRPKSKLTIMVRLSNRLDFGTVRNPNNFVQMLS